MADDLDRLLDEVERRLCRLPGSGATGGHRHSDGEEEERAAAAKEGRSAKLLMSAGSSEEDIDDIIDEICNDSSFAKTPLKSKSNSASLTPESTSAVVQAYRKRCCPVYLGGSSSPYGIGTNISKRTCDQLRCTACDFRVSLFNDYIWDQSCDYLFFSIKYYAVTFNENQIVRFLNRLLSNARNNMPELNKLRAKMIKKKGARAYACQCSWRSIDELTDLQTDQQLRWVCEVISQICHFVCTPLKEQIPVVTRDVMYSVSCSPSPSASGSLDPAEDQHVPGQPGSAVPSAASVLQSACSSATCGLARRFRGDMLGNFLQR